MEETVNLAREKIADELKKMKLKGNQKFFFSACFSPVVGTILGLVLALAFKDLRGKQVIIGLGCFFAGVIMMAILLECASQIRKNNLKKIRQMGQNLHQIYFENSAPYLINDTNLKFKGLSQGAVFGGDAMNFQIGNEKIVWEIDQDVVTIGSGKNSETFYHLKYVLGSSAKKFADVQKILISKDKRSEKGETYFQSESIEFNERYAVQSLDKMEVYKVFSPKIIENFCLVPPSFLQNETIEIGKGLIIVQHENITSKKSWYPSPFDYGAVHWSKSKILDGVMDKLILDFERYLQIQLMLEPLQVYN